MLHLVRLTPAEVAYCRRIAAERHRRGQSKIDRYGTPADPAGADLIGALGEYAGALWFDTDAPTDYQHPAGDLTAFGTGTGVEIRATAHAHGRLIVYPADPADRLYVLARVTPARPDRVWLAGCYRPVDGLDPDWWDERRAGAGAWWVPQTALRPLPARVCG